MMITIHKFTIAEIQIQRGNERRFKIEIATSIDDKSSMRRSWRVEDIQNQKSIVKHQLVP
jgi:hypothetical protein